MTINYDAGIMAAAGVLMVLFGSVYGCIRTRTKNQTLPVKALAFKAAATCMAAGMGICAAFGQGHTEGYLLVFALLFCAAADIELELEFKKGAAVFGLAHLCFISSFWIMAAPRWRTVLCFIILYLSAILMFHRGAVGLGDLKILAYLYMAILCFMVSMALTVCVVISGRAGEMIAAGAVCFFVSDCVIAFKVIHGSDGILCGAAILILYYSAVYLLGSSLIFYL